MENFHPDLTPVIDDGLSAEIMPLSFLTNVSIKTKLPLHFSALFKTMCTPIKVFLQFGKTLYCSNIYVCIHIFAGILRHLSTLLFHLLQCCPGVTALTRFSLLRQICIILLTWLIIHLSNIFRLQEKSLGLDNSRSFRRFSLNQAFGIEIIYIVPSRERRKVPRPHPPPESENMVVQISSYLPGL